MLEFRLNAVVALDNFLIVIALRMCLGHLMRERFHFLFDFEQMAEDGETFFHDGAPGERHPILRKISGRRSLGGEKRSVVERLDARQNLQQG